ncbi:Uncharacterised protein [uncultured archaeon]|nr:Uncharacterised protein [uncultured archaeon]
MNRAQGSTEYLVLLAVALVVALVVVGILGWFPGLGGGASETQSKTYWAGAMPFSITVVKLAASGSQMTLSNRLSDQLTLTSIRLNTVAAYTGSTAFTGGQENTIAITTTCTAANSGKTVQYDNVTITYNRGKITGIRQVGDKPLIIRCSS